MCAQTVSSDTVNYIFYPVNGQKWLFHLRLYLTVSNTLVCGEVGCYICEIVKALFIINYE